MLSVKKNDHVFRQGEANESLYFIKNGLLKAYYITVEGKEFVKSLLGPSDFIGSLTAAYSKATCSFNLVCLEDSEILRVEFDQFQALAMSDKDIARFAFEGLLTLAMKKERREFEFLCCSPEERYQLIRERNPELLNKVTQNDIAKYLGITPVALSRIKSRAMQNPRPPKQDS